MVKSGKLEVVTGFLLPHFQLPVNNNLFYTVISREGLQNM
jgi:hypothetical protein